MSKDATTAASLTEAERHKRRAATEFARAFVGLDGFKPSEYAEAKMHHHMNGEIDFAELVKPHAESVFSGDRFTSWPTTFSPTAGRA